MLRKFYNADASDAGGEAAVVEQPVSIAAIMAKQGVNNGTGEMVATPIDINKKEVKEEGKTETPAPAATAIAEEKVETKATETKQEKAKEEPKKEEATPIAKQEPVKVPTWQEVLKNQQPDTVLKELGYDEKAVSLLKEFTELDPKMVDFLKHWKANGDVKGYLQELSTDYSKMSAEEVMRHQLRVEYPKASAKALEALYESEVVERFKIDPETFTEAEVEKGRLLLEAKADKHRDEITVNQQKFLIPKPPEPKAEVKAVDNSAEIQRQNVEAYKRDMNNDPYTKDIIANKKITLGEGDEKFTYPVDAGSLIDFWSNTEKQLSLLYDKQTGTDGNEILVPKTAHQLLVAAVAEHGMNFLNEYAKHYKALGGKALVKTIENASEPDKSTSSKSEAAPTSPAAVMAKSGKINYASNNGQ